MKPTTYVDLELRIRIHGTVGLLIYLNGGMLTSCTVGLCIVESIMVMALCSYTQILYLRKHRSISE
jgi:hypothetical protein